MTITVSIEGKAEFDALVREMQRDFGEQDAKKILNKASYQAMEPVLTTAKNLAPKDTGALASTLRIYARKPTSKDKKSKYVKESDTSIAMVTTKAFPKKLYKKFHEMYGDLYRTNKKAYAKAKREFYESHNSFYDARAVAQEFGTAKMSARPYLRPALETNIQRVVNSLKDNFKQVLEKYRARQARKTR
jgi:HK97 gp10 family phage protein